MKASGLSADVFAEILKLYPCPPHIVLGIIATESSDNPDAMRFEPGYKYLFDVERHAKILGWTVETEKTLQMFSWGLMQLMLATAREMGFNFHPRLLLQPKTNVSWGAKHLWNLFRRYQNWGDAVAAYNYGHAAKKMLTNKYKNQEYVDRVYYHAAGFQRDGRPSVT
jgi:soluble lytic murein transglycosylase-like protein